MTKWDVTKVAKSMIDVADGMEMLGRRICNCGKSLLMISKIVSEYVDPPKRNSAQDDLRKSKIMIKSKFMAIKVKSSKDAFEVFFMKILIFILVVIVKILDVQIIGNESVLRTTIIFFYIFNEGISLLENARKLGMPFLTKLKSMLEQLTTDRRKIRILKLVKSLVKTISAIIHRCYNVTR